MLVHRPRYPQDERRNSYVELFAQWIYHLILAVHRPKGSREWTARRVLEGMARLDGGLFTHYPISVHFFHVACRIRYYPMARQELNRFISFVCNSNSIRKKPLISRGGTAFGQIAALDLNSDISRYGF